MSVKELLSKLRRIKPKNELESLYLKYKKIALNKIDEGKLGNLILTPKSVWLKISENCNLKCIGCYKEGQFKKIYTSIEDVKKSIKFEGLVEEISLTTNEPMLHPQLPEIIDICRHAHPTAKIWMITNGTIPIKGRYKAAIAKLDKVGLSIDGATKVKHSKP